LYHNDVAVLPLRNALSFTIHTSALTSPNKHEGSLVQHMIQSNDVTSIMTRGRHGGCVPLYLLSL